MCCHVVILLCCCVVMLLCSCVVIMLSDVHTWSTLIYLWYTSTTPTHFKSFYIPDVAICTQRVSILIKLTFTKIRRPKLWGYLFQWQQGFNGSHSLSVIWIAVLFLDSRLPLGIAGPPKWDPCSRLGIYVRHLPSHAGSVALVLNPRTRHVSPQFNVVFNDTFSTIPYMEKREVPPNWADLGEK